MAKILVVDDSETTRTQVKMDLSAAGHEVVEAENGLQGLEALNANKDTKLIICDVNMPEMDGLTMCKEVHKNDEFNKLPIFMLTTQCSEEMKIEGKKNGVVAWINKPHKPKALIGGIKKMLARAK